MVCLILNKITLYSPYALHQFILPVNYKHKAKLSRLQPTLQGFNERLIPICLQVFLSEWIICIFEKKLCTQR
jgi:hypothetical protein